MKGIVILLASVWYAQSSSAPAPDASPNDVAEMATRMTQLMESTALAIPGLPYVTAPVRRQAEAAVAVLRRSSGNPSAMWDLMNQVNAYLALADSTARPNPFPAAADRQFAELREDLDRMQRQFGTVLQTQNTLAQAHDADPNDLKRYAEANTKLLPAGKTPGVVFLGDSVFEGWRLNEYFTGRDFLNRAIAGQTTSQMLARFRQDVISLSPKAVVILAGSNDIANGVSANQIEDNLFAMLELARAHDIRVIFASILPVSDYHKDADPLYERSKNHPLVVTQAVNHWLQTLCQSQSCTYMDYYAAVADPASQLKTDLSDDGLNPNSKGYRVISPLTLTTIDNVLTRAPAPAAPPQKKRISSK